MWTVFDITDSRLHAVFTSPLSPLDTQHSHSHTHTGVYMQADTAPHVVRQTEIADPSPAVPINPSLSEDAPLGLGTVITLLHLLHLQPSLKDMNTFPKGAGWHLQPFKWSSWVQALFHTI